MAAHRWWRVKNIQTRNATSNFGRTCAELRFINTENILSNNPQKAIAESASASSGIEGPPGNAFDGDINTISHNGNYGSYAQASAYWLGYVFDTPVTVVQIQVQMRKNMNSAWGQEWQTADIEYSDDGTNWIKFGYIEPKIAAMDLSLVTVNVIKFPVVQGKSLQDDGKASRFVLIHDWASGNFIQKVVPAADGSWSYTSSNANKLIVTHIGAEGFAPQTDGPITPV